MQGLCILLSNKSALSHGKWTQFGNLNWYGSPHFDGISFYLAVMCHTTCFLLFIIIISSSIIIISKCIIMVCLYLWGVTVSISYLTFSKACSLFITCLLYSPCFLYFFVSVNILHWVSLFFLCLGLILHLLSFYYLSFGDKFVCLLQDSPASILTSAKKKISNIGIFLKVGWSLLSFLLKTYNVTLLFPRF